MKTLLLTLVVLSLGLAGCAISQPGVHSSLLDQVSKGDSRKDVVGVFGRPHYRYSKGNTEFLLYGWDADGDGKADSKERLVLMMVEGKLFDKGTEDRENGGLQSDDE